MERELARGRSSVMVTNNSVKTTNFPCGGKKDVSISWANDAGRWFPCFIVDHFCGTTAVLALSMRWRQLLGEQTAGYCSLQ